MSAFLDLSGQIFGELTVVRQIKNARGSRAWLCRCSCSKEVVIMGGHLRSGGTKACGHLAGFKPTHGKSHTSTYKIWEAMRRRCANPKSKDFLNYGGRGIEVCERWRDSFKAFLVDMGERPLGLTLDRIDNNRGYEPGNCRWTTRIVQRANRR